MVWNMRSFTAAVAIAAFVLEGLAAAPPAVPVALLVVELLEVTAEEEEGDDPTTDADADAGEDEDEDDETEDVPESGVLEAAELSAPVGGGLASAGLVSAPVPQGMAWPPGCVA